MPGLVDLEAVFVEDARVVLDEPIRHDHVSNPQRGIQAARHSGEHHDARSDLLDEERCSSGHGHLSDPRLGQDHVLLVEPPRPGEDTSPNGQRLPAGQGLAQGSQLWLERGDDQDHGRRRLPERVAAVWYGPRRCAG